MAKGDDAATTLLYVESTNKSISSSIRMDDLEVFMRVDTYRQQLLRLGEKFAIGVKWLPHTSRYNIWKASRLFV